MPALKTTARGLNNIKSEKIVVNMSEKISLLRPNAAPLTVLSKKIATEETNSYRFDWMEDDLLARWITFTATTEGTPGTTLTVDSTSTVAVDDLLKNPVSGEVIRVTAVASGTSLTVVRGYGTTAAANLTQNVKLLVIGNAIMQGDSAPGEKYSVEGVGYNYTQIFRTPFSVTNTLDKTKLYGGPEKARQRLKKGIEHKLDMEYAFLFGEKKLDTTGAQPRTMTGGVLSFLAGTTNVVSDTKSTYTEDKFMDYLEQLFTYGSQTKVCLANPGFITLINKWVKNGSNITVSVGATEYGLKVMKYVTAHGEIVLVKHPLLINGYAGHNIFLDMECVKYRPLNGRDTVLKTNIQAPDEDGQRDEYLTEAGIEVREAKKHGVLILT